MLVPSCGRSDHPAAPGVVISGVGVGVPKEVEKVLTIQGVVSSSIIDLPLSPTCGKSRARSDKTDCVTASRVLGPGQDEVWSRGTKLGVDSLGSQSEKQNKVRNAMWQVRWHWTCGGDDGNDGCGVFSKALSR